MSRLAIGTAQFGMAYGIANRLGQVQPNAIATMLEVATQAGVDTLDTAINYGNSEAALGRAGVGPFRVVTKLPEIPADVDVCVWVREKVQQSLRRLGIGKLYGLLLHRAHQLADNSANEVASALAEVKERGWVEKVGVSIYGPEILEQLRHPIDLLQAPYNLLDQRLFTSGWGSKLADRGVEIHTRSAFLQGLLLMKRADRPMKFNRWDALWDQLHAWLAADSQVAAQACLQFCLERPEIAKVVVGVESVPQLQELLDLEARPSAIAPPEIACDDELLINPANWTNL
jgi:aryl-alcohol dehydrogenase-like predicted oxidoreductase